MAEKLQGHEALRITGRKTLGEKISVKFQLGTSGELITQIEEDTFSAMKSYGQCEGFEFLNRYGFLGLWSKHDISFMNNIFHSERVGEERKESVVLLMEKKSLRQRGAYWFQLPRTKGPLADDITSMGFLPSDVYTGMAARVSDLKVLAHDPRFEIRNVETKKDLEDWNAVFSEANQLDEEASRIWHGMHQDLGFGASRPWSHSRLLVGGKTVGTSTLYFSGSGYRLSNVGVLPEFRNQGVGSQISLAVTAGAARKDLLISLISTPSAVKMYEKIGFQRAFDCPSFYFPNK